MILPQQELNPFERGLHEAALAAASGYQNASNHLLEAIMEVDRARLFERFGRNSTHAYCMKELGLTRNVAGMFIRVARVSETVPELAAAVRKGMCVSKAIRLTPVITPENQAELLEKARTFTYEELEKEIARGGVVRERVRYIGKDRLKLELGISEDLLQKLRRVQDLESGKLQSAASFEQTLEAALEIYLDREDPVRKAERASDSPTATGKAKAARGIPAGSVHAVNRRDQGKCQAVVKGEKCHSGRWTEMHHIRPLSKGGDHSPENLTTLCAAHHRQIHTSYAAPRRTKLSEARGRAKSPIGFGIHQTRGSHGGERSAKTMRQRRKLPGTKPQSRSPAR